MDLQTAKVKVELSEQTVMTKMVEEGAQTDTMRMEEVEFVVGDEEGTSMVYSTSEKSEASVELPEPTIWNLTKRQKLVTQGRKSLPV